MAENDHFADEGCDSQFVFNGSDSATTDMPRMSRYNLDRYPTVIIRMLDMVSVAL